jgi:predicted AlkP superfamily pyrophosphatase or phosphodiesterase
VPLERVLLQAGHRSVERLALVETDGTRHELEWAAVADRAWWLDNGRIWIDGRRFPVLRLEAEPSALLDQVQAHITDIAPTAASALGLPAPARATGQALEVPPADRVLLIFLDGFGYVCYTEALRDGLIPHLAALGEPLVGLTTYPPATSVATASLLTGAPPKVHGVNQRGIRQTDTETLFDVAAAAGRQVVAIEGNNLSFNLRNADVRLSGDMDGNGSTDDNVLSNAMAALESGMPDLFFVHLHGIDDDGHTYGPGAPEEQATIRAVDAAVGQIVAAMPPGTLILIFADHGMHSVDQEGRLGNHGHLIERDMFIPIFVTAR